MGAGGAGLAAGGLRARWAARVGDAEGKRSGGAARAAGGGGGPRGGQSPESVAEGEPPVVGWTSFLRADWVGLGICAVGLAAALHVGVAGGPEGLREVSARDSVVAFGTFVGALLWVKLFDLIATRGVLPKTVTRKIVHITCGPFFVVMWPLFSDARVAPFLAGLVPAAQIVRFLLIATGGLNDLTAVRAVSREGNRMELLRGPFYYCVVLLCVTLAFWRDNPAGAITLAAMCGGDGFADVVGRRWGRGNPLPFNPGKSWAGSAGMFVGGSALAVALLALLQASGSLDFEWEGMLGVVALVMLCSTVLEALPVNNLIDDNISVPLLAAGLSQYLLNG